MTKLSFYKDHENRWYIDYALYPGPKADLEMVAGADTMLDIVSENKNAVTLNISEQSFAGASHMQFKGLATEIGDGAWYHIESYRQIDYNLDLWLCGVTQFVLGRFPENLYFAVVE